jgi:hypothetical protein
MALIIDTGSELDKLVNMRYKTMVGVPSVNQESLLGFKARRLCISQLLTQQELADMVNVPLKVAAEEVIGGKDCYVVQGSFEPPIGG